MGISSNVNEQQLRDRFQRAAERIEQSIIERLFYVGEELVNHARQIPSEVGYTDRTGNLRSSTGYILVVHGEIIHANFEKTPGVETSTDDGVKIGRSYAEQLAKTYTEGYVLILVAGMEYALFVEATGRDVLTSTELLAGDKVPDQLRKLKEQVKVMKL